jgi:hypothetical protein
MHQCICGKSFAKKINFGRHLTTHKNFFLSLDENNIGKNYIDEEIIGEDENDMSERNDMNEENEDEIDMSERHYMNEENEEHHIVSEDEIDMMSEDGGFKNQEEKYLSQDSDLNDDFFDRQEKNVFIQQSSKDKNNFQIPYNLISEECYDFVQLVIFK